MKEKDASGRVPQAAIETFIAAKRVSNSSLLNEMKKVFDSSGVDYRVIPGNYDPHIENIFGVRDLHGRGEENEEVKIFGYGGADAFPQHIGLLNQLQEIVPFDHGELYGLLTQHTPNVVLSHNPPKQLCDTMFNGQHVGTPALTRYIVERSPSLVLCGHIHEAGPLGNNPNGVKGLAGYVHPETHKRTLVLNTGNLGRFALLDPQTLATAREFDFGTFLEVGVEDNGVPTRLSQYSLSTPNRGVGSVRKIGEFNF